MKTIYVNRGVKNYLKEDHRSYIRNLCSCEKKFRTSMNFFQAFFSQLHKLRIYNCNDLPSHNTIIIVIISGISLP